MSHAPPRRTWPYVLATVVALVGVGFATWHAVGPPWATATTTTVAHAQAKLPKACTEALELADELAPHARPLGGAAIDHVVVMDRLERGEIDGTEAFQLSGPQMAVMEAHGARTQILARQYAKLRKRCPLR